MSECDVRPTPPLDADLLEATEALYRDLHRHPELSWQEERTARQVAEFLRAFGLEPQSTPVTHSVAVTVRGAGTGRSIACRADLDALPIQETTGLAYASETPGVMHACGHDLHTATVAALAVHQHRRRATWSGELLCFFQPSEEQNPSGAEALVEAGVLDHCHAVIGIHVDPRLALGRVSYRAGVSNAGVDALEVELQGGGGHAARPHLTVDTIRFAAQVVFEFDDLVRRHLPANEAAVLTVTTVRAGDRSNIVPPVAHLRATLRTLSKAARERLIAAAEAVLGRLAPIYGATYEFRVDSGQPPLVNDPDLARLGQRVAAAVLGSEGFVEMAAPSMGADDFSVFGERWPSLMVRIGILEPGAQPRDLHAADFVATPKALDGAARYLATLTEAAAAPRTPAICK